MKITKNKVVALAYVLKLDDGIVVDASDENQPLMYLHGHQNIIPGLENELENLEQGDKKEVKVAPEDGYGVRHEELVQSAPKDRFPEGSTFTLGDEISAQDPDGLVRHGRITEVNPDEVVVDFNHMLAGQTLNFFVTVGEIRDASQTEIAQGQVQVESSCCSSEKCCD
ncbi:MAG: peptidylprolyl isomerase [Myxococcales bacterium]|nr:peptidylprolyl isomerase [Myxococcales bacterium]|tara:strand:+ start:2378 stop:2881 length:504 start_codon:yes stop_codon:yes gene_type:complete